MRLVGTRMLVALASVAVSCLLIEGIHSITRWDHLGKSLSRTGYEWAKGRLGPEQGFGESVVLREEQFEELLVAFRESGVGLGNTPYSELVVEASAINFQEGGCLRLKPNQRKSTRWLRTLLFEPFNKVAASFDQDRDLADEVDDFLGQYSDRSNEIETNATGERVTVPASDQRGIALVAGDSVAFGAGVSNADTLASQLQRRILRFVT